MKHVAVVTFQAYTDKVGEVIDRYRNFGIDWMKSQPGLVDFATSSAGRRRGRCMSSTFRLRVSA